MPPRTERNRSWDCFRGSERVPPCRIKRLYKFIELSEKLGWNRAVIRTPNGLIQAPLYDGPYPGVFFFPAIREIRAGRRDRSVFL